MNLPQQSLEQAMVDVWQNVEDSGKVIALKPTKVWFPPFVMRWFLHSFPIRKARGARGRKKALKQVFNTRLFKMLRRLK